MVHMLPICVIRLDVAYISGCYLDIVCEAIFSMRVFRHLKKKTNTGHTLLLKLMNIPSHRLHIFITNKGTTQTTEYN